MTAGDWTGPVRTGGDGAGPCSACDSIARRKVAIPKGTMVAGFGKGKWVRGDEAKDADPNLLFHMASDQDEVLFNGAMVSLRQLIMEQRKKDPEARRRTFRLSPRCRLSLGALVIRPMPRLPWHISLHGPSVITP